MKRFLAIFIRNSVFVNLFLIVVIGMGLVASKLMVKELFPEIKVDVLMVEMAYPGADPEEIEEGISRKIEQAIDGIEGIKKYTTVSSENVGRTAIEVVEGFDVDALFTDVRNAIDAISTFPVDAEKAIISEASIRSEVIVLALWGSQDERVLKEFAEDIKDEIQALPSISQVSITGTRDYEISIEVPEERLREYGLTFAEVARQVREGSINLTGGVVRTKGEEIRLRTVGRKYTGEEFSSIVVLARPDGEIITLDRIASIRDGFIEDNISSKFNGEPAVMLKVFKTPNEDAIQIADAVRAYVELKQGQLPAGMNMTLWSDYSEVIRSRLQLLQRNGIIGLAIVFFSLWLFLDIRLSFWVTMGIPISLSGGLLLMWMYGATLNTISTFSLIMVLGIIVDDAIIVGEAVYVHRKRGDGPAMAAVNGVMEVGIPVLAAVTTSIIAFLPLLFVGGVMGKFVSIIPVAVVASLTMSLVEALFLLPAHLNHLPEIQEDRTTMGRLARVRLSMNHGLEWFVDHVYYPAVNRALHYRYVGLSVAIFVLMFTVGMVGGGFIKFALFPDLDANDITTSIEFPPGTPPSVTAAAVAETRAAFDRLVARTPLKDGIPLVKNIHETVGESAGDQFERAVGNNLGMIRVELASNMDRLVNSQDLLRQWEEEVGPIPGALSQSFTAIEQGPPGAAIMITIKSENTETLLLAAAEIKEKLHTYDGIYQISDTYRPGKNELRMDLKPEARGLGLTLDDLAQQVYAGFYGEEALRIQRGRDDIRVKVRYTEDQRSTLAQLEHARIRTPQGFEVPFFSVANVHFAQGLSTITRQNGVKSVTITAENDPQRANADEVLNDLRIATLIPLTQAHADLAWEFEGAQQQSRDAFQGLMISFPIALLAIFVIIATVFRSYVQPLVIMTTVPFGIIGAVYGHLLLGFDLAMFSVFGMVALTGVVVNDAIVMIEAVNTNIANGMPTFESICRGGARRFRAILLTTLTTVGGLTPLIMEKDTNAQIVIPMALSLAAGVAFATVLTLFLVPCLLGILSDARLLTHWLIYKRWATREEVEPARHRNRDPFADDEKRYGNEDEPVLVK